MGWGIYEVFYDSMFGYDIFLVILLMIWLDVIFKRLMDCVVMCKNSWI